MEDPSTCGLEWTTSTMVAPKLRAMDEAANLQMKGTDPRITKIANVIKIMRGDMMEAIGIFIDTIETATTGAIIIGRIIATVAITITDIAITGITIIGTITTITTTHTGITKNTGDRAYCCSDSICVGDCGIRKTK